MIVFIKQGDVCDSSDEEWDQHIGHHARAFLGLNEPIAEIALDEGVGMGQMVRNAFARAYEIRMQASLAGCSSTGNPDGLDADVHDVGLDGDEGDSLRGSESDMDMFPDDTASAGSDASAPRYVDSQESSEDNRHVASRGGGASGDVFVRSDNAKQLDNPTDCNSAEGWDAGEDTSCDDEDLEDMMGLIPHEQLGANPEIDMAATLPLYEGSTLSMLCATLLIVNCCRTHSVSNMFLNELLMLLSLSILPAGNCLPKSEYEASKILRRLGLQYNMVHACPNGCCLFKGDLEDKENCPVCDKERYRCAEDQGHRP